MKRAHLHLGYGGSCRVPPVPGTPALDIRNLYHYYSESKEPALENISLTLQPGERVALVGPNGAGKSTLLKLILGLEALQQGSIHVYGNPARACRHRVAIVPQRQTVDWIFPVTVRQVVEMGRYVHLGWFKRPKEEDRQAVQQALEAMKIEELAERRIGELSGGQQQRVMLSRTLAHDADLLLLDEPLNNVDLATQELIFHTIEELTSQGKTAIVSTHDLGILKVHFGKALFLDTSIIAEGPVAEVLTADTIARAYGFEFHHGEEYTQWLNG